MTQFAVINEGGEVINLIVADSLESAQEVTGLVCVQYAPVVIGSTYADGVFTPPTE